MNARVTFVAICAALSYVLYPCRAETVSERAEHDSRFHLYWVFFRVTVDTNGNIQRFELAEVLDFKALVKAKDVKVPRKFCRDAQTKFGSERYQPEFIGGTPMPLYTFRFYTPEFPDAVISDLHAPIEKQP